MIHDVNTERFCKALDSQIAVWKSSPDLPSYFETIVLIEGADWLRYLTLFHVVPSGDFLEHLARGEVPPIIIQKLEEAGHVLHGATVSKPSSDAWVVSYSDGVPRWLLLRSAEGRFEVRDYIVGYERPLEAAESCTASGLTKLCHVLEGVCGRKDIGLEGVAQEIFRCPRCHEFLGRQVERLRALHEEFLPVSEALRLRLTKLFNDSASKFNTLLKAICDFDVYTYYHTLRVGTIAVAASDNMNVNGNYPPDEHLLLLAGRDKRRPGLMRNWLLFCGLMHDVGKIATSQAVLKSPIRLEPDQRETYFASHVRSDRNAVLTRLETLLRDYPECDVVLHCAMYHHEPCDGGRAAKGGGYHRNIAYDTLSLPVRLMTICDVLDALCSPRPYKAGMAPSEAMREADAMRGTKFDGDLLTRVEGAVTDTLVGLQVAPLNTLVRALSRN